MSNVGIDKKPVKIRNDEKGVDHESPDFPRHGIEDKEG